MNLRVPLTEAERERLWTAGVELDDGRVMLLENPDAFVAHYFRHRLDRLQDFHLRLIAAATQHRLSLTLFPAGHGKTTLISTALPVWRIARDPDTRGGLIAKNESDARSIMRAIHAELLDNEDLIQDFGPFKDPEKGSTKAWGLLQIEVAKRTLRHPRPTLQVYGSGGNVFGHRAKWVVCDDVVTDKNSSTPETRAKTREWFNMGVRTMPEAEDDPVAVVGTRFHPEDLYGDLIEISEREDAETWHVQHEDAIVDEDAQAPLWPEHYSWARLMALKEEWGTLDFNKRYRNIAVDADRMVFKEPWVKGGYYEKVRYDGCLDRNYKIGDVDPGWRRYAGFDPAIGVTGKHSWCVHTTLMVGSCSLHERCYWIVDMVRDTMSLPRQADTIIELHERYECLASKLEANAYQKGLHDIVEERMKRAGVAYRIEPHHTTANKIDPEIGVQALGPYFERGQFHIPWGDPASKRVMHQLIEELVNYPNYRTDDCVMSLWIAFLCARDEAPRFQSFSRLPGPLRLGRRRVHSGQWTVPNPHYADLGAG